MSYTADSIRDLIQIRIVTPDSIRIQFERKRLIRRSLIYNKLGNIKAATRISATKYNCKI